MKHEYILIGYTTLELLGFKVNPITGKLERAMPIEYREKKRNNLTSEEVRKVLRSLEVEDSFH